MICHIRKNQNRSEELTENLKLRRKKIKVKKLNEIENGNRYKTPNSVTRREHRPQSLRGLNMVAGSHARDADSYRTASRNVTMNATNEKFQESYEFSTRSSFQPTVRTASRDSVI